MESPVNYPAQDIRSLPVLCFDLDGTLLDKEQRIHPADAAFLQSSQRAWLVPTTRRPLHSVKRTFFRHRLFPSAPLPFPLVLQNGAVLYGPSEKVLEHQVFEEGIQGALIDLFKTMPFLTFYLIGLDSIQVLWPDSFGD
jgi:hydroxymethylpyrimidine pyrophosphatase-like HAD family hydrolase